MGAQPRDLEEGLGQASALPPSARSTPVIPEHLRSEEAHAASLPWWRRTSSFLIIFVLFVLSWVGQLFAEAAVFIDEQREHGEKVSSVWDALSMADFWEQFWQSTLENWQSEFLQVSTWVLVGAVGYGLWKRFGGSSESKDSDERIEAKVDELLRRSDS